MRRSCFTFAHSSCTCARKYWERVWVRVGAEKRDFDRRRPLFAVGGKTKWKEEVILGDDADDDDDSDDNANDDASDDDNDDEVDDRDVDDDHFAKEDNVDHYDENWQRKGHL